jgi:hypothetical protein
VQYRNIMSWKDEHIVPSTHLDLEILTDQTSVVVLKLRTAHITLGALIGLAHGDGAKKRLARHRLNLVDADINAWSCLVNSPERQELRKERLHIWCLLWRSWKLTSNTKREQTKKRRKRPNETTPSRHG